MVYVNYSPPTDWQGVKIVTFAFSSVPEYHDIHFTYFSGKSTFEPVKTFIALMKQTVPSSKRNYDSQNKIHTLYLDEWLKIKTGLSQSPYYKWRDVGDVLDYVLFSKDRYDALQADEWKKRNQVNVPKAEAVDEFFYHFKEKPTAVSTMTAEELGKKLIDIIATDIINKRTYRVAAMKLHPDLNNGDGSKMSELNMLWQEYIKLCPEAAK